MKQRGRIFLVAALLAVLPVLSACELLASLGIGGEDQQRKAYEEQLKAQQEYNERLKEYQEQQEAYRRAVIEAYNEQLKRTYEQYGEGIQQWNEARRKQLEGMTVNQTGEQDGS